MKEFKGEISGILNWALEGWRDFRKNDLVVPEAVEKATSEYKSESDTLEAFVTGAIVATRPPIGAFGTQLGAGLTATAPGQHAPQE